jgi:hypothetical protein
MKSCLQPIGFILVGVLLSGCAGFKTGTHRQLADAYTERVTPSFHPVLYYAGSERGFDYFVVRQVRRKELRIRTPASDPFAPKSTFPRTSNQSRWVRIDPERDLKAHLPSALHERNRALQERLKHLAPEPAREQEQADTPSAIKPVPPPPAPSKQRPLSFRATAAFHRQGHYLRDFIGKITTAWEDRRKKLPQPEHGTAVTVQMVLTAAGEVTNIEVIKKPDRQEVVDACLLALTSQAPFPRWTAAMASELGSEQKIELTFHWEPKE